ncbi:hypothetical protein AAZX31_04G024400 [Glycine max]|uniref:Uncharacterized protein n=1 Tax=Glycine max TaxID=3847 RepID=A0A0R0KCM1_SOYBN
MMKKWPCDNPGRIFQIANERYWFRFSANPITMTSMGIQPTFLFLM